MEDVSVSGDSINDSDLVSRLHIDDLLGLGGVSQDDFAIIVDAGLRSELNGNLLSGGNVALSSDINLWLFNGNCFLLSFDHGRDGGGGGCSALGCVSLGGFGLHNSLGSLTSLVLGGLDFGLGGFNLRTGVSLASDGLSGLDDLLLSDLDGLLISLYGSLLNFNHSSGNSSAVINEDGLWGSERNLGLAGRGASSGEGG